MKKNILIVFGALILSLGVVSAKKKPWGAAEYDVGSSLPWILGVVGVLLIGGAIYWFYGRKKK